MNKWRDVKKRIRDEDLHNPTSNAKEEEEKKHRGQSSDGSEGTKTTNPCVCESCDELKNYCVFIFWVERSEDWLRNRCEVQKKEKPRKIKWPTKEGTREKNENSWFRHLTFAFVGINWGDSDRFLLGSRRTNFGPPPVDDLDRQSSRRPERKWNESRWPNGVVFKLILPHVNRRKYIHSHSTGLFWLRSLSH